MDTPPEKLAILRDDLIRLEHIVLACRDIATMINARNRADLDSNMMLRRALVNAIQEIGEASTKITAETRQLATDVPWGSIVATRNIVVHVYWGVDLDRIWNAAVASVPRLLSTLQSLMDNAVPHEMD